MIDPRTLPATKDPEIIPAVEERYRHRRTGELVEFVGFSLLGWKIRRSDGRVSMLISDVFWANFIHASTREDAS